VIFTCTWTVQHLNVPEQREWKDPGLRGDIKWGWKSVWESAKWMCITILAPEALVTLNLGQPVEAWWAIPQLKQFAKEDNVSWTLTHSLFANMGGFVIRENAPERVVDYLHTRSQAGFKVKEGLKIGEQQITPLAEAIQIDEVTSPSMQEQAHEGRRTQLKLAKSKFLLASEILALREQGMITLPYITKEEIMDKSKSDIFARVLAIGQTLWLVVQMIVRASRHLEVSQLEIGTAAFASCAVTIYALNWHKPKGVGVPWTICSYPGTLPKEFSTLNFESVYNGWWVLEMLNSHTSKFKRRELRGSSIPNHHRYTEKSGDDDLSADTYEVIGFEVIGFILSSTAFGAIHFAAVKSTFPSHIELVLWCMASGICTGVSLIMISTAFVSMLYVYLRRCLSPTENFNRYTLFGLITTCCVFPLYIIARLFLIVELFQCLFFLPPSAFVATWVSSIPHVS
jgi:hypothetical protein